MPDFGHVPANTHTHTHTHTQHVAILQTTVRVSTSMPFDLFSAWHIVGRYSAKVWSRTD